MPDANYTVSFYVMATAEDAQGHKPGTSLPDGVKDVSKLAVDVVAPRDDFDAAISKAWPLVREHVKDKADRLLLQCATMDPPIDGNPLYGPKDAHEGNTRWPAHRWNVVPRGYSLINEDGYEVLERTAT